MDDLARLDELLAFLAADLPALGGKIELTVTRLAFSIPASRSDSSNDERRSLWTPTPLVKKIAFGTNISCISGYPVGPTTTPPGPVDLFFSESLLRFDAIVAPWSLA